MTDHEAIHHYIHPGNCGHGHMLVLGQNHQAMTVEKYINCYDLQNHTPDQLRGMIRDLDDPDVGITRDEARMKREALMHLLRQKTKPTKIHES